MRTYDKIDFDRATIRDEVIAHLHSNVEKLARHLKIKNEISSRPNLNYPPYFNAPHEIKDYYGLSFQEIVQDVCKKLQKSGRLTITKIEVRNSSSETIGNVYNQMALNAVIFEEVSSLIQQGALIQATVMSAGNGSYDMYIVPDSQRILLTEYGLVFITNHRTYPYYVEKYLAILSQDGEVDEILAGCLEQGLMCLQKQLYRAAAILLRCALERVIEMLAEKMGTKLEGKLAKDIDIIHDKIAQSIPKNQQDNYNRMKIACHSIRNLGNDAAHNNKTLVYSDVQDHYLLFSTSVYRPACKLMSEGFSSN